ncbi:branched-chain amino acid ABC transporter permease [Candidatus Endowatersipora endosymbiont of Watersipora subatra]|uniref:branched-chain amino acid ABC transporter permease n=1 Tax=Candidatus Endowatersipora endosymbiont of Watersipora subatra TaxID=3077946 RepID=UPI00312CA0B3
MMRKSLPLRFHCIAVASILLILPIIVPSYVLATEILIFGLAVIGCNLLLGYTGLLSFGQALFFGSGAYLAGLMSTHFSVGLLQIFITTIFAGALIAVFVGYFAIHRIGIYFVMLTLAFAQLGYYIAFLTETLTGGEDGLLGIERPSLLIPFIYEFEFTNDRSFYILTAVVFILVFLLMQRLVDSPFGSVLGAIKQNQVRAEAIGYQVKLYKIAVFAFSGAVTALAGALYAFMLKFAPLSNIDVETSEQIMFMTVLGGLGSLYGSLLGSAIFLLASDFFSALWPRWMISLGLFLIIFMLYMPGGVSEAIQTLVTKLRGSHENEKSNSDADDSRNKVADKTLWRFFSKF